MYLYNYLFEYMKYVSVSFNIHFNKLDKWLQVTVVGSDSIIV